jgi:hypothetical protein
LRYLLVALVSSALTAGAVGAALSRAASSTAKSSGRTIIVKPNDTLLIGSPVRWHCGYDTYSNGKPYVLSCEPSDWHLRMNDNPVVQLYANAATVATQIAPRYTSATRRYTAVFSKAPWTP